MVVSGPRNGVKCCTTEESVQVAADSREHALR